MTTSREPAVPAEQLRATTKWVFAGAVAVASALIALVPTLYPRQREIDALRVISVIAGVALTTLCIVAVVAAASRVLGPRPTTVRDLLVFVDQRSKQRLIKRLLNDLNRTRLELLPSGVATVRRLWDDRLRGRIDQDAFEISARKVLLYCDDRLTAMYFGVLLRRLIVAGPVACLSIAFVTGALATAPPVPNLEWLGVARDASVRLHGRSLPEECENEEVASGLVVAVGRDDTRYLFVSNASDTCEAFARVLDALEAPPMFPSDQGEQP